MAYTGQNVCDRAREQLNDDFKRELTDAELLNYVNDVVKVLRQKRPDMFVGVLAASPADIALGGTVPAIEDWMLPALIDYVVGMAMRPDDEENAQVVSNSAMAKFMNAVGAP